MSSHLWKIKIFRPSRIVILAALFLIVGAVLGFGPMKIEEARAAAGGVKNNPKFI